VVGDPACESNAGGVEAEGDRRLGLRRLYQPAADIARPRPRSAGLAPLASRTTRPGGEERVVRHLTAEPEAAERIGAARVLTDEFTRSDDDRLKWAIANALATLATKDAFEGLIKLLGDRRHGQSREMLCDALKRTKGPRAPDVLIGLVDDRDVAGHAILALRLYGPRSSLPHFLRAEGKLRKVVGDANFSEFSRRQHGRH
jgi:hypothetical protein